MSSNLLENLLKLVEWCECPMCYSPMTDSILLICGHFLCAGCYDMLLDNEKNPTCIQCCHPLEKAVKSSFTMACFTQFKQALSSIDSIKNLFSEMDSKICLLEKENLQLSNLNGQKSGIIRNLRIEKSELNRFKCAVHQAYQECFISPINAHHNN